MADKPKFVPRNVNTDMVRPRHPAFSPKKIHTPHSPPVSKPTFTRDATIQTRNVSSPLFPDKAVGANVPIEPFYKTHPLCAGLDTKGLSRVRQLYTSTDIMDSATTLSYGEDLRSQFGDLIDQIIAETTGNNQYLTITTKITRILDLTRALDIDIVLNPKPISLWDVVRGKASQADYKAQDMVSVMISKFRTSLAEIETLTSNLSSDVKLLVTRVDLLEQLFDSNKDNFDALTICVIAGKMILEKQRTEIIPYKESKVKKDDLFKVNEFEYYKDSVNRFERKVEDLQVTSVAMLQQVQQIRMMQINSKNLAEMIQRVSRSNIPNWKAQCNALIDFMQAAKEESLSKVREQILTKGAQLVDMLKLSQQSVAQEFTK